MNQSSLVQNLPALLIFDDDLQILKRFPVYIDGHIPRAGGTFHKNEPPPLVLGKAQKVRFPIDLKIHSTLLRNLATDLTDFHGY